MRGRLLVASGCLLAAVASLLVAPGVGAAAPAYHPSRLTHLGAARQVVVVTSSSWRTSYATLRTYRKGSDGVWRRRFDPMRARIGGNGFVKAADRRQGTGTTPAGTFRVTRAFGSSADPGTAMRYRRFDRNDWWPYDPRSPRTYNVYQYRRVAGAAWRRSWAEHLWDYYGQYRYAAVIKFNLPSGIYRTADGQRKARHPADTRKGGGIFLHVNGPGATAGCVSLGAGNMRKVLRWLNPTYRPRIVMGPKSAIGRM